MRQTNNETKENQKDKKGKMLSLFNEVGKACPLDKDRKVITEVVKNSFKGGFITFFIFLITSEYFIKSSGVKSILSIILFQSLIDLTWTDLKP